MTYLSFPDAVAERSGRAVSDVTRVLAESRIPTSDTVGAPHRLRVTRLAFTGSKAGLQSGDIDFDQVFSAGLWAITSQRNDAGKTSLLEIIMWCLRGHPKRLQDDVRAWLHTVRLEGTIDDKQFIVEFELTEGVPAGSLVSGADVRPFASDAAFADTMSEFMMERLGFDTFTLWVEGQGVATHRWPSYSTVLYLPREAEGAVIGDMAGTGVAQRLVQLFVGIGWARTYSACQAALREVQSEERNQIQESESLERVALSSIAEKRSELAAVRARMAALPSGVPSEVDIAAANANRVSLINRHADAVSEHREAERDAKAAHRRATRERRRLADVTEAALARRLFHGLDPTKCPRCSTDIGPERKEAEKASHSCAVCDRELDLDWEVEIDNIPIESDEADEAATGETLQQLVSDLESLAAAEHERVAALAEQVGSLAAQVAEAEAVVETYSNASVQVEQRRTAETQATALEAVIAELENLTGDVPESPARPPEDASRQDILQAAFDEAKFRRDTGFAEVVDEVNTTILDLARRFGFTTLEEVKLNLAAQLRLVKGGAATSFSHQTPGEKLRLRIAVVVALLRVAHTHGVGRHPGLLLIDSIGAEETEPGNLSEFMRELQSVTAELGIQIMVASARSEILTHVPVDQRVSVTGDEYLW